ncbi:Hypothetical predicted protein, partial [Pelobates cultripes]
TYLGELQSSCSKAMLHKMADAHGPALQGQQHPTYSLLRCMATLDAVFEIFWAKLESRSRMAEMAGRTAWEAGRRHGEELQRPQLGKEFPDIVATEHA